MTNQDDAAFARPYTEYGSSQYGLTKREYFAAMFLAALEFDEAVGEDGAAIQVAEGVLELADELTGSRDLTDADKARLSAIAKKIVDLPDENAETKLESLFDALLNAKDTLAELVAELNTPTVEPPAE